MIRLLRTHFKTPFGCDRLQSPWDCVVGKNGSRRTSVRLRALFTSGLAHKLFARPRFKISFEMSSNNRMSRQTVRLFMMASLSLQQHVLKLLCHFIGSKYERLAPRLCLKPVGPFVLEHQAARTEWPGSRLCGRLSRHPVEWPQ